MPYAIWLDGPIDTQALQVAIDALIARQAVFRTSFVALDGVPEQVVADAAKVPVEHIDLPAGLDGGELTRLAEAVATERACQRFDLASSPLIRATLIAAGPDRHLLVLVMHHIVSDGVSMKIIMDELSAFYRAELTGTPAALDQLWMQYGDYAVWQQDMMSGEELGRQMDYWRDKLRAAPQVLNLPSDRPRPAHLSSSGDVAEVTVDGATTRRLAEVALGVNATMFMLFLAGFVAVLSRYARQSDVVLGTQVSGRTHSELDPIVGLFTNTAVLRVSLAGDPTFIDLLGRVRDATVDALAHEELPFEKLVEELSPDRTLAHSPLIQVQFVHGSLSPPTLDLPGVAARSRALLTGTAKLDLTLYADTQEDQVTTLNMEYSTDLFDPPWAARFLRSIVQLLESAAKTPGMAVADLEMLTAAEREAVVIGRNQATPPADGIEDVRHVLQASSSSVTDGEESVPMSEVCARAARLARILADHGVGTQTLVGLCVTVASAC